ncbi:MAG TPA: FtsK/SpoIIIE domain-containing protein [Planctomycetaceae bacterium]|nr:FtsK/SpoIIIE domain-containing protein [Planctomycetaceae bacterium]
MSDLLSLERPRQLLRRFLHGLQSRTRSLQDVESLHLSALSDADLAFREGTAQLSAWRAEAVEAIERDVHARLADSDLRFDEEYRRASQDYQEIHHAAQVRYESAMAAAEKERDDALFLVDSILDENAETSPKYKFENFRDQVTQSRDQIASDWQQLEQLRTDTADWLERRGQWRDFEMLGTSDPTGNWDECRQRFAEALQAAHQQNRLLRRKVLPNLVASHRIWLWLVLFLSVVAVPVYFLVNPQWLGLDWSRSDPPWIAVAAGAGLLVGGIICGVMYTKAAGQIEEIFQQFDFHVREAQSMRRRWQLVVKDELARREQDCERWYAAATARRTTATDRAHEAYSRKVADSTHRRDVELRNAEAKYPPLMTLLSNRHAAEQQQLQSQKLQQIAQIDAEYSSRMQTLQNEHASKRASLERQFSHHKTVLLREWNALLSEAQATSDEMCHEAAALKNDWNVLAAPDHELPRQVPPAIPIGEVQLALREALRPMETEEEEPPAVDVDDVAYTFPVVLPFPDGASLLLKASDAGRRAAVEVMQTVMLRLLTSLPPGCVRFTILDPVGLGENFGAFMHLADYDELLVSSRIWTESAHIEQRLADLTEHMENVLQTYLRNEFQSIEEYNAYAGEVAEPYHILVAANFPANFSDAAARRLVSIATTGARCGVYTLISVDTKQSLPHRFPLSDITQNSTVLEWQDGAFRLADAELKDLPLTCDPPPPPDEFTEIVKLAGRNSKDARRVEVSFDRIAPRADQIWQQDSRGGIEVPLGRAGATKLQYLRLGRGTSQHVLVAGKTGSGKSSFLHALITNLALHYSPEEIEFYLIDFKKGVEFKTYAAHELPHARVIGIESDREFGVSALQRLDALLKERGELFRREGVQDIAAYRNAQPNSVMPRALLVVDEFQEFFVEDDPLAQTANLLLDRLVRQGRAFGIHVLLGSQTLGGAYTLARSTLGQVAVRVALQCSENDAHLILSEENTAARLLTRPGEAIYNDANGLSAGNHPFQIAWLPDERREQSLELMRHMAEERGLSLPAAVVFEGHLPADPSRNQALSKLIRATTWQKLWQGQKATAPVSWLGEAVAIKDPTAIAWRRQSGQNLLIVGQNPAGAIGILANAAIALAAQLPAGNEQREGAAKFCVLDGSTAEAPHTGIWTKLGESLQHPLELVAPQAANAAITEVAAEVARRNDAHEETAPPIFVLIDNLARFRDLRKADDDFGFGGFDKDKPPSPAKQLGEILSNGPHVGVHVLAWCDSPTNVKRWVSREMLREFELRVVFQMSATDSSNLIDSPAAGRLGPHRAILHLEEQGTQEKFRPYGTPSDEWLAAIREHLGPPEPKDEPVDFDHDDINRWTVI